MKTRCLPVLFLWTWSLPLFGQVVPAAEGPRKLPVSGTLQLSFRYAHVAEKQPAYDEYQTGAASVDLDYVNDNQRRPFQMMYTGGYSWMFAGPSQVTGLFQRLYLAQRFTGKKWSGVLSDDFGYLPAAPTTGFSGIPGIGEPIGVPNPGMGTSQSILTVNTHTIENTAYGAVERTLNHKFSVRADAGWGVLRYPDNGGFDSDSPTGSFEFVDRLSARTDLLTGYRVSQFTYSSSVFDLLSQSTYLGVTHAWKRFSINMSAGPEWAHSSSIVITSSPGVTANMSANYTSRFGAANVMYSRGINNGSGYFPGARLDMVNGGLFRDIGRTLIVGITGSYMRTTPLVGKPVESTYGGVQVTRKIGRYAGIFGSYTALRQASNAALPDNVLNGVIHVISAGVEFSPRVQHIHR